MLGGMSSFIVTKLNYSTEVKWLRKGGAHFGHVRNQRSLKSTYRNSARWLVEPGTPALSRFIEACHVSMCAAKFRKKLKW
eukprot:378551-Amphidinium_carterae.1